MAIKIDQSFVIDMLENKDDEMIVGANFGLARNSGRRLVAEGIEDNQTEDRLLSLACQIG
nr:EAL domain-containing protein [Marinobacter sp. JH2]